MEEADLYDDILGGTLSPSRVPCVEALLEIGVHRRVLRLPEGCSPLQAVREVAARLLSGDAGLRDAVGKARLVFQRRSLKFDTWVDIEAAGERPVADGERLRALSTVPVREAGEVVSSDAEAADQDRRRRSNEKRRHKKRRHRSGSADGGRRRHRRHRRHRRRDTKRSSSRGSSSAVSADSEEEGRRRKSRRSRKERHSHSHRRRNRSRSQSRSRSRSSSSHSGSDRSRSTRRSRDGGDSSGGDGSGGLKKSRTAKRRNSNSSGSGSGSGGGGGGGLKKSRTARRRNSSSSSGGGGAGGGGLKKSSTARKRNSSSSSPRRRRDASPSRSRRVAPPRPAAPPAGSGAAAWQHMDPDFADQLRQYELDRARREGREEFRRHLSDLADISDGELSSSDPDTPKEGDREEKRGGEKDTDKAKDLSDLGLRVLDRLKKLREELGGGDSARRSAGEKTNHKGERSGKAESMEGTDPDIPEPTHSKGGRVYAGYLNLDDKNPVMALHEYCTARLWKAPYFHMTEKPSDSKKQRLFTAAVKVNDKMYTMTEPGPSKKDGKRSVALYCLQKLGVLKQDKRMELGQISLP